MDQHPTLTDVVTIFALFLGPMFAVFMTRWLDDRRFKQSRRLEIFKTLMRTRQIRLSADHVNALNLIEVDFHNCGPVLIAWKEYRKNLFGSVLPVTATADEQQNFLQIRNTLLAKLLDAMAKALKIEIEQLDIFEGGYYPVGWQQSEATQQGIHQYLLEVLSGTRALPITAFIGTPQPPYPPRPPAQVIPQGVPVGR